jgi:hypothetical protein
LTWKAIDDGGVDDEHMFHSYPFMHLAYFSQREENRDIIEKARNVYGPRLRHPFPIVLKASRELEIEARLRWLEEKWSAPIRHVSIWHRVFALLNRNRV